MKRESYTTDKITASLYSNGGKAYIIELTLWTGKNDYSCDGFEKVAELHRIENNEVHFGFAINLLKNDLVVGSDDIWITDLFPVLKNKELFSISLTEKGTALITVLDKDYFNEVKNEKIIFIKYLIRFSSWNFIYNGQRLFIKIM